MDIVSLDDSTLGIIAITVVVFLTALVSTVSSLVITRINRKLLASENIWDDAFIHALSKPVKLLIWTIGLAQAVEVAALTYEKEVFPFIYPLRDVLVISCFAWFGLRFIKHIEKNVLDDSVPTEHIRLDNTTVSAVAKLLRITVIITTMLIGMQTLGFSVSGILAFGGIGGMAVGFAAKDLLSNFFGAMMIYLDRPFKVGDWIRSPDKDIEGTVEEIGWRLTRIRTFDKRPLYVPNSVFTTIIVENPSRMLNRRIYETIGVRYTDMKQVNAITKDVESMLKNHPEIDTNQTLMVHLNRFGASSVDFFIYTFTKTTDWQKFHAIKQGILLKISGIIDQHDADIAFPTQTLHMPELEQVIAKKSV